MTHSDKTSIKRINCGASKLTVLIFSLIFGTAFYAAYRIIPIYYSYFELQNQAESMVRLASTETNAEIRKRLVSIIQSLNLPFDNKDEINQLLLIERDSGVITISITYSEPLVITFFEKDYTLHHFDFEVYAEGSY
jgi:hypothetical protein